MILTEAGMEANIPIDILIMVVKIKDTPAEVQPFIQIGLKNINQLTHNHNFACFLHTQT